MAQVLAPVLKLCPIRTAAEPLCCCSEPEYVLARVLQPDGTVRIERWCIECGHSMDPLGDPENGGA